MPMVVDSIMFTGEFVSERVAIYKAKRDGNYEDAARLAKELEELRGARAEASQQVVQPELVAEPTREKSVLDKFIGRVVKNLGFGE